MPIAFLLYTPPPRREKICWSLGSKLKASRATVLWEAFSKECQGKEAGIITSPKSERKEREEWVTGRLRIRKKWSGRKGWKQKFRDHEVGFLLHVWESTGDGQSIWRSFTGPTTHQIMSVPKGGLRGMAWCRSQPWETHGSIGWPCKVNLPKVLGQMICTEAVQHCYYCPWHMRICVCHRLSY